MKKATIAASAILAVAIGASTLAACSGGSAAKNFKLSAYAHPLDSLYAQTYLSDYSDNYAHDDYTGFAKTIYVSVYAIGTGGFASAMTATFDTSSSNYFYALYDVKHNREVDSRLYFPPTANTVYGGSTTICYYTTVKKVTSGYSYSYYGPDGSELTNTKFFEEDTYGGNHVNVEFKTGYRDENGQWRDYYHVTYVYQSTSGIINKANKYFSYYEDKDGEPIWEEVEQDSIDIPQDEYTAGTQLTLTKTPLIYDCDRFYPDSKFNGMEYSAVGTDIKKTYTFYKDGEKLSTLTMNRGEIIGYAGNYVYFTQTEPVSADAKNGYNLEMFTGISSVKYNVTLYRYNIMKDRGLKKVSMGDYVILTGTSLYNYSKGEFDGIGAMAVKKHKGVAVYSIDVMNLGLEEDLSTVILNKNGKPKADLSGTVMGELKSLSVYKLTEDRYLTGNYILDGKCNVVANLGSSVSVWGEKQLISTYISGYGNAMVNYDGEVVIEPVDGTLSFYGDAAYANGKIYSAEYPSGIDLEEVIPTNVAGTVDISVAYGLIFKTTVIAGSEMLTYKVTVYNLHGQQLGSIENLTNLYFNSYTVGGKVFISAEVYTDSSSLSTENACWKVY